MADLESIANQIWNELEAVGITAKPIAPITYKSFSGKSWLGFCRRFEHIELNPDITFVVDKFLIKIDTRYSERVIKEVLVHEMLHALHPELNGTSVHSAGWLEDAKKMEKAYGYHLIESHNVYPDEYERYPLVMKCNCGKEFAFPRVSKSIFKTTCNRCGKNIMNGEIIHCTVALEKYIPN